MKKALIAAIALTALACGGSSKKQPASSGVACHDTANAVCWAATGAATALTSGGYGTADCNAQPGTVVASCPTANRVGTCAGNDAQPTGQVAVVMSFYQPWPVADAQNACAQLGGTWTAG